MRPFQNSPIIVVAVLSTPFFFKYDVTSADRQRNRRRFRGRDRDNNNNNNNPHRQPESYTNCQSSFNTVTHNNNNDDDDDDDDYPEGYNPYRFIVETTTTTTDDEEINDINARYFDNAIRQPLFTTPPQEHFSIVEFTDPDEAAAFAHDCKNRNVTIERDPPVFLQSPIITPDDDDNITTSHRHLAESIPWGINRVFQRSDGSIQIPPPSYLPSTLTHQICIIDSGYQIAHPDLTPTATNADPSQSSSYRTDDCGHGSHVAGTILATDNDVGVIGVFPGAPSLIVKVFAGWGCGWTYQSTLLAAVNHCAARMGGAGGIISMSLGGSYGTEAERRTFRRLYGEENILSVAAAGNGGNNGHNYPASYGSVMSVGATDSGDNIASFSQHNDEVDIAAPGVSVRSTALSGYETYSGTSMATPHVSGVALLLWNKYPGCTNEEIRQALESSAVDLGSLGRDDYYGNGLVNYWRAVEYLQRNPCGVTGAPTTRMPTVSPVTSAPTVSMAPTPTCRLFELELQTDNYGVETSWLLTDDDDDGEIVLSGGPYPNKGLYRVNDCLVVGSYTFTLTDAYGDGMCCSYGQGYYEIKLNGRVLKRNEEFKGRREITPVIVSDSAGPTEPPTPSPSDAPPEPTRSPTPLPSNTPPEPTTKPTPSPTVRPTVAPPCGLFELQLKTDKYGTETSWTVRDDGTTDVVLSGGPYERYTIYDVSQCLPAGSYTFTINDSYADGICCSYGRGYYEIKLYGRTLIRNEEFKGRNEATPFVITPPGPTGQPTPSPTMTPTLPPTVSPTPFPTVGPPTSCKTFLLRLKTDKYGYETHWTLMESGNSLSSVRLTGGPYALSRTTYFASDCLPTGSYIFTMHDTYGDGMCCNYGEGSYDITLDDEVIKHGDRFGSSEVTQFVVNDGGGGGDVTGPPTSIPTTSAPTVAPSVTSQDGNDENTDNCDIFNFTWTCWFDFFNRVFQY